MPCKKDRARQNGGGWSGHGGNSGSDDDSDSSFDGKDFTAEDTPAKLKNKAQTKHDSKIAEKSRKHLISYESDAPRERRRRDDLYNFDKSPIGGKRIRQEQAIIKRVFYSAKLAQVPKR